MSSRIIRAREKAEADVIVCREHAGAEIKAAKEWKQGEEVEFMYMPKGTTTVTAGFRDKAIELTVTCNAQTAEAVQASYDAWLEQFPKQKPFGCIEHEEKDASVHPVRFSWKDGDDGGVYMAAEPTSLGVEHVNGKIHRSWSPTFLTDADYTKASLDKHGVYRFAKGARGSAANPAMITGIAFCVGTLTNKPAFKNINPVAASEQTDDDAVTASEQSEAEKVSAAGNTDGAKKGWETKLHGHHAASSDAMRSARSAATFDEAHDHAITASVEATQASSAALRLNSQDSHEMASDAHYSARKAHAAASHKAEMERQGAMVNFHDCQERHHAEMDGRHERVGEAIIAKQTGSAGYLFMAREVEPVTSDKILASLAESTEQSNTILSELESAHFWPNGRVTATEQTSEEILAGLESGEAGAHSQTN